MGVVYLAKEKALNRFVALKVLPQAGGDSEAVGRFLREGRAIAALDHPAIVPIYAYGEVERTYFIAMKPIEGRPLNTLEPKPLAIGRAVGIVEQIARALQHAHERGVIHRDVKPSNILVGADDRAWLVDFGIAKLAQEPSITREGEVVGTPPYMSPEQTKFVPLTGQTDVYSLGAALYAVVTGQMPFDGPNAIAVLTLVATKEPAPPSTLRADLPYDLEVIILGAMAKETEKRYENAGMFADDLERFTAGEPILGPRPSPARVRHVTQARTVATSGSHSRGAESGEAELPPPSRGLLLAVTVVLGVVAVVALAMLAWTLKTR
jgi:serine/threonine-protein kinase